MDLADAVDVYDGGAVDAEEVAAIEIRKRVRGTSRSASSFGNAMTDLAASACASALLGCTSNARTAVRRYAVSRLQPVFAYRVSTTY
jgi:hypothetical protein